MSGMFLHIQIDAGDFLRFRREAIQFATIFEGEGFVQDILEEVGEYVLDQVMLQFVTEGGQLGTPWAQLSDSRQRQRSDAELGPDHPILIAETEKLINSWKWDWLDEHSILIGMYGMGSGPEANDHYGAWNTFGVESRNLPSRPMLVVTDEMVNKINEIFENGFDDHFIHFFGGGGNYA